MRTTIYGLEVTSTPVGAKPMISDDTGDTAFRHHRITVKNPDNNREIAFDYYPSIARPAVKNDNDAADALGCFVNDCYEGSIGSIDDFASEFGYDATTKISTVLEIYDAVCAAYQKAMYLYDGDTECLDWLRDQLDEDGRL